MRPVLKVVLKRLGNGYGRRFANYWEFVRFAQEQHLVLDFTTPPNRPARPAMFKQDAIMATFTNRATGP